MSDFTPGQALSATQIGILPTYKGYTVDYRLKQFRKVPADFGMIEFVEFDSEKGENLLSQMIRKDLVPQETLSQLF